jgi:hypothetical protein
MSGKEITADANSMSCVEARAKSHVRASEDFDKIRDSFFLAISMSLLAFFGAFLCAVMNHSFPSRTDFFKKLPGQRILLTEQMLDAEGQLKGSAVVGGHAVAH